jgi:hypothetical protein
LHKDVSSWKTTAAILIQSMGSVLLWDLIKPLTKTIPWLSYIGGPFILIGSAFFLYRYIKNCPKTIQVSIAKAGILFQVLAIWVSALLPLLLIMVLVANGKIGWSEYASALAAKSHLASFSN